MRITASNREKLIAISKLHHTKCADGSKGYNEEWIFFLTSLRSNTLSFIKIEIPFRLMHFFADDLGGERNFKMKSVWSSIPLYCISQYQNPDSPELFIKKIRLCLKIILCSNLRSLLFHDILATSHCDAVSNKVSNDFPVCVNPASPSCNTRAKTE